MQKTGCVLSGVHQLKFAYVECVHLGEIGATALFHVFEHGCKLLVADHFAREQPSQRRIGRASMHFGLQIDQKLWLRSIVRRITVDLEKAGQAVDQVVDGWREVRSSIAAAPLVKK